MTSKPHSHPSSSRQNATSHAVWRLSDPEHRPFVEALKASFDADPCAARAWLLRHGFITHTGKLSKQYGG